ncbi:hopene-associated glycosyltransferase HpnB [Limimonas halophila]|uniref:Hopene-associated glycosyltransferase HpnB n=1 Tax=Limimonas halophila TaxID=1082479 RepID=A0A1G7P3L2_9PROT|nr:glycosyltransferase [Limimonas halophila]SDF80912.1 hopene-associated glycosyltransferase HpnB [Limimonas halophila]
MQLFGVALVAVAALAWAVLLLDRGGFWRLREWLPEPAERRTWPGVAVLIPARNEGATIAATVESVLGQAYAGELHAIVVDDQSDDGTAAQARLGAERAGAAGRLAVIGGTTPPPGWTGKLWALEQGWGALDETGWRPDYLWLTDADITHVHDTLARLVTKADADRRDLVSLMVRLSADGPWAKLAIPAFIFFFRKLYPFAWANDPKARTAAAAGGCVLLRRRVLAAAGGFDAIHDALIDDCALARAIKRAGSGRIWLGMADRSHSLRPYTALGEVWHMVARTAYAQLRNNPLLLAGTVTGMLTLYVAPPLAALTWPWHANPAAGALGLAAWLASAVAFAPTLRHDGRSPALAPLLPVAAAAYTLMTLDSARRYHLGRGGLWKGRAQAANTRASQGRETGPSDYS